MGVTLKGLDNLLNKLDKLSNISTRDIIEEVADGTSIAIKEEARKFSDTSYLYCGKAKVREYGISCFIDVGFSTDNTPFELWKPLWFQHWGFYDHGLNFSGQFYVSNNRLWFDTAVKGYEKKAKREIKKKLQSKVRKVIS